MKSLLLVLSTLTLPCLLTPISNAQHEADVVVYGGTSAGVITAVQAIKMGKTAIVIGPDKHLGGLSSGGLGWTDSGKKETIGGLSREFYHRIWKHYEKPESWRQQKKSQYGGRGQGSPAIDKEARTMWIFEPSAAEQVFEDFVADYKVPVMRDEWLDRGGSGVTLRDGRITEIRMLSGVTVRGKMFVDATYEGDLIAAAGVATHVGREGKDVYGEDWNGVQVGVLHHRHWFMKPVSPYKIPGDPDSGLIPRVSGEPPGEKGDSDKRIQAYCFRMCLTNAAENRIPFPKPEGYDPSQYELMKRVFATGWRESFGKFDPIPNFKTDTNNHGPFSTDNIGMNYGYPEGSYAERAAIIAEHRQYQQGYMYFLANDPSVPPEVQKKMKTWGLPKDEFVDNGNWSHQLYIREARRMIGDYVMTEHDCLGSKETPDSVGMGSYTLDSHNVQRYIKPDGFVQNEGDIGVRPAEPYEIAYGSLVPKKNECQNLLVPICISSSHIAFGSIRMEPVFMILGQSCATAASLCIDQNIAVQDLDYAVLKKRLEADGQVLSWDGSITANGGLDPAKAKGIVLDDSKATKNGTWSSSSSVPSFFGIGYIHDGGGASKAKAKEPKSVTWKTTVKPGSYEIRLSYTANKNRASKVPVQVRGIAEKTVTINQRDTPPIDEVWISLGQHAFGNEAEITISNAETDGYVIADAVQLLPVGSK